LCLLNFSRCSTNSKIDLPFLERVGLPDLAHGNAITCNIYHISDQSYCIQNNWQGNGTRHKYQIVQVTSRETHRSRILGWKLWKSKEVAIALLIYIIISRKLGLTKSTPVNNLEHFCVTLGLSNVLFMIDIIRYA
jgi:hypothetical protein